MVKLIDLARKQTRTLFEDTELLVIRGLREQLDPESTHVSTKKSEENADKSEVLLTFAGAEIQDEVFKWTTVTAEIHTKKGYSHANSFADEVEQLVELLPKKVGSIAYVEIVNSWTRKENGDLQGLEVREITFDVMIRGKRDSGGGEEGTHFSTVFDYDNPYFRVIQTGSFYMFTYDPPLGKLESIVSLRNLSLFFPAKASDGSNNWRGLWDLKIEQKGLEGTVSSNMDMGRSGSGTAFGSVSTTGAIALPFTYGEYKFDKEGDWTNGEPYTFQESKFFTPTYQGVRGGTLELVFELTALVQNNFFRGEGHFQLESGTNAPRSAKHLGVRLWHPDADPSETPPLIPWEEYMTSTLSTGRMAALSEPQEESEEPPQEGHLGHVSWGG